MLIKTLVKFESYHYISDYMNLVPVWLQKEATGLILPKKLTDQDNLLCQIIAGCLLGDGHLVFPNKNSNSSLSFHCAWKDHNLSMVLSVILCCQKLDIAHGMFTKNEATLHKVVNGENVVKKLYRFKANTQSHPLFTELHSIWYNNHTKAVPNKLGDLLTPVTLAFWFMGDGGRLGNSALAFNSHGFTLQDQLYLSDLLLSKFGLKSSLNRDKQYHRIVLNKESSIKLAKILAPLLHESVHYKFKHLKL